MFRKIRSQHRILSSLKRQIYWTECKTDYDKQRLGLMYGVFKRRLHDAAASTDALGASFLTGLLLGLLPAPSARTASWLGAIFSFARKSIVNYLLFDPLLDEKTKEKIS